MGIQSETKKINRPQPSVNRESGAETRMNIAEAGSNGGVKTEKGETLEEVVKRETHSPKKANKNSQAIALEKKVNAKLDPMTGNDKLKPVVMSEKQTTDIDRNNLEVQKPDLVANAGLEGEYERSSIVDFNKHPELLTDWQYYNLGFENKYGAFHKQKAPPLWSRGYEGVNQGYQQYNRSYRESFNQDYKYSKEEDAKKPYVGGWMEMGWNFGKAVGDVRKEESYELKDYNKTATEAPDRKPSKSKGLNYKNMLENDIRDMYRLDRAPLKRENVDGYVLESYKDFIDQEVSKVGSIDHSSGRYRAGFERLKWLDTAEKKDTTDYEYNIAERDDVDMDAVYYNFRNKETTRDLINKVEKNANQEEDMKAQKSNKQIGNKVPY